MTKGLKSITDISSLTGSVIVVEKKNGRRSSVLLTAQDALEEAKSKGLSLILVKKSSSIEQPDVVEILDEGKEKYEREKRERKNKFLNKSFSKSFYLSPTIEDHDLDHKIKAMEKNLKEKSNTRVKVILKITPRTRIYKEHGLKQLGKVVSYFSQDFNISEKVKDGKSYIEIYPAGGKKKEEKEEV